MVGFLWTLISSPSFSVCAQEMTSVVVSIVNSIDWCNKCEEIRHDWNCPLRCLYQHFFGSLKLSFPLKALGYPTQLFPIPTPRVTPGERTFIEKFNQPITWESRVRLGWRDNLGGRVVLPRQVGQAGQLFLKLFPEHVCFRSAETKRAKKKKACERGQQTRNSIQTLRELVSRGKVVSYSRDECRATWRHILCAKFLNCCDKANNTVACKIVKLSRKTKRMYARA